jgi:hypothetical protein
MLRWFVLRRIAAAESAFGECLDYLRFMLRASLGAFLKFAQLVGVATYRRALPAPAFHVVRVTTAKHEDCGPCVQTTVNMAKKDGVGVAVLRAVVEERPDALPEDLRDMYLFTKKVLDKTFDEGELREKIRARYQPNGDAVLTEIAVALSSARAFPVTKRVLGYATSCRAVKVVLD